MAKKLYIVTGEASGDILASRLMLSLRKKLPDVQFFGLGGETMAKIDGFRSIFDVSDISVMGIWEVLPRLPLILRRVRQVAADIERVQPDALLTVDSWGFVHQLYNRLQAHKISVPRIHYVAPQVWAWKKGRAKTAARLIDRLMTLLPNEAAYFEKYGLQCDFVGHPVLESISGVEADAPAFRQRYGIPPQCTLLAMLPGSRKSEIKRLAPIFKDVIVQMVRYYPDLFVIVPAIESMAETADGAFEGAAAPYRIVLGQQERYQAFYAVDFAVSASGTVSLELASCGTPHVVAYKFGAVSNILAERMVRPHIRFGNLANLLADREIIPECMLKDCYADNITKRALDLMQNRSKMQEQIRDAKQALSKLCSADTLPSEKAADVVLQTLMSHS